MKTSPPRNRLLLVSDDSTVLELLGEVLRCAGFSVVQALDGRSAVALLSTSRMNAVVLDYRTPFDLKGAAARTRSPLAAITDIDPFLPLVLTCGADDELDLETTLMADLVLRHPVAPKQIVEGLHLLLTESMRDRACRKAHDSAALRRHLVTQSKS